MNEKMPIPNTIFPIGEKNTAYAQYFVGQSYLNMLTTKGLPIGNVTFEPGCRNNWLSTMPGLEADKFSFVRQGAVTTRPGEKLPRNSIPATWW